VAVLVESVAQQPAPRAVVLSWQHIAYKPSKLGHTDITLH